MLEILQFIFSSFWVWLGCYLMTYVVVAGLYCLRGLIRITINTGMNAGNNRPSCPHPQNFR